MEVFRTVVAVMGSIKTLVDLIEAHKKRGGSLKVGLNSIKYDLELVLKVRAERKELQKQLTPAMQLQLQELVYDLDDFIQGLWVPGDLGSFILLAIGADTRPQLIQLVEGFKERIKNLKDELPKSFESIPDGGTTALSPAGSPIPYAPEADLVGIEGPKSEIVELLSPRVELEPHLGRLCVISIVGCNGSGKTALARALYEEEDVVNKFDFKSWVVASDPSSAEDLVNKIRQQVVPTSAPGSTPEALHHFQKKKRYLIFVDDVLRGTQWKDITNAFHENVMDSRIILTTRVPSVARDYSYGSYEYAMPGLDQENSRKLFRVKFREMAGYPEEHEHRWGDNDVDIIIDKFDGLPVALISAAECLRRKGLNPDTEDFKQVSQELRDHLACSDNAFEEFQKQNGIEATFAEMRRARVEPYNNQLNNGEKECLLYASIFPCGHEINSKSLIRRLIAEGLVPGDPDIFKAQESVARDARECVRKLMDQRMIEPVPIRSYSNVAKRCRVHSIMLHFTINKAVSRNFVSVIHKDQPLRSTAGFVRRLTVQSSPLVRGTKCPEGMELSVLRSLAIFKSRILDFEQCKLVRVLDLEGCCGLTPKDLDKICGLLFLKYLSLRNTDIHKLPENVKKLNCLETLDTRGTLVEKLPVEVIMLPRFAYLFGKVMLINMDTKTSRKLTKFFSEKRSQLRTLGGISIDDTQGLEILLTVIQHATKLKKVKVWYRDAPTSPILPATRPALVGGQVMSMLAHLGLGPGPKQVGLANATDTSQKLAETLKERSMDLESVSIDFNGITNTFLDFLQTDGTISSIKLRRGWKILPGPDELAKVSNLKKLHLFSTGLESKKLAVLQHLKCLQYLKLAEDGYGLWHSEFHVEVGGFISLIWLCFEAPYSKHPPLKIDHGVKTPLTSLLLLCKGSQGTGEQLRAEGISHLAKLNEVILDPSASDAVVTTWKEEAKKHINRPYVERQQV